MRTRLGWAWVLGLTCLCSSAVWGGDDFVLADRPRLERALEQAVADQGELSLEAHRARGNLWKLLKDVDPERAVALGRQLVRFARDSKGARSGRMGKALYRLGVALRSAARYQEAESVLRQAFVLLAAKKGEGATITRKAKRQLARVLVESWQLDEAEVLLREILDSQRSHWGATDRLVVATQVDLARLLARRGDRRAARDLLSEVVRSAQQDLEADDGILLYAQMVLGKLERQTGDTVAAEALLQSVYQRSREARGVSHARTSNVMRDLGMIYWEQGRLSEALGLVQAAYQARLESLGKANPKTAAVAMDLARVYQAQGELAKAEALVRQALDARSQAFGEQAVATQISRRVLGAMLVSSGRVQQGLALLQTAQRSLEALGSGGSREAETQLSLAKAYLSLQQSDKAVVAAKAASEATLRLVGRDSPRSAEALAVFARALRAHGDLQQALEVFRQASDASAAFLNARQTLSASARERQEAGARALLLAYLDALLAALVERPNDPALVAESFRVAELARSRSVQQALLGMASRAAAGRGRLADWVRQEQDLRASLGALEDALIEAMSVASDRPDQQLLAQRVFDRRRALQARLREVQADIARDFPQYRELMNPAPASLVALQRALSPDEALVSFFSTDSATLVWALTRESLAFKSLPLSAVELRREVGRLRAALDVHIGSVDELPRFNLALAHRLYRQLFGGLEAIEGKRYWVLVPHAGLLDLPFGALVVEKTAAARRVPGVARFSQYRQVPWLALRHGLGLAPSATAWLALRSVANRALPGPRFLGLGDPHFSDRASAVLAQRQDEGAGVQRGLQQRGSAGGPMLIQRSAAQAAELASLAPLPETAGELRGIARALGQGFDSRLLLGRSATEAAVKQERLADFRVLVFATHGLLAGELAGQKQPALALTPPQRVRGRDDGLLEMDEILGLKLNADWLVLSACNTAASGAVSEDNVASAEGLSGLSRAFFYAGARAMLVSLWSVESLATQRLTTALFRHAVADKAASKSGAKALVTRADALQRARADLIQGPGYVVQGKELFSYAHPFFWAAFVLVGDAGTAGFVDFESELNALESAVDSEDDGLDFGGQW